MFGQSELLPNAVGNGSTRLELVEMVGGGRLGNEVDFEGAAEVESVIGRRLD